jgi:hypothetical protein
MGAGALTLVERLNLDGPHQLPFDSFVTICLAGLGDLSRFLGPG